MEASLTSCSRWGEFEISITMHFTDPAEKPVEVFHMLKLYHDDGSAVRFSLADAAPMRM
jgi:transcription initiation factor IIF auxiliary subunit